MMPNRWQDENERQLRVVERIAAILSEAGIPRMSARVLAYMLAGDADRYTAAALAEGLRISPAAVSGAVRYLTATRMLVKEREPGKRAEFYRVRDGDLCGMIVGARIQILKQWESALEAAIVEIGADRADRGGGRRLGEATAFIAFLRSETEELLERWSEYRRDLR
ncbi:GbsR/MarR family transcriptional regulator [Nocardioides sp.]|uniref:GbsR/MarR family transcriptional regulator n=1 Tax=Nocardioides sp. TaxID=35761 RepID=UPI002732ECE0|nr:helix-turn-helix domain-containing protein [Nocardioides sp.]MDP3893434.1 helix-turn-helix domain-containing protein [Nocardioides sp.]